MTEVKKLAFPEESAPLVSIIIPVFNQFAITKSCLAAIASHTPNVSFEILVADDGSTDETVNLELHAPGARRVVNPGPEHGFVHNVRHAVEHARGKYLMLLNNDTIVAHNWLAPLVDLLEQHPKIGVTGPILLNRDGTVQELGSMFTADGEGHNLFYGSRPDECREIRVTDSVMGSCMLVSRELWDELGGLDVIYAPGYLDDSDFCMAVRFRAGRFCVPFPGSQVVHFIGKTFGGDEKIQKLRDRNRDVFRKRWGKELNTNRAIDVRTIL